MCGKKILDGAPLLLATDTDDCLRTLTAGVAQACHQPIQTSRIYQANVRGVRNLNPLGMATTLHVWRTLRVRVG